MIPTRRVPKRNVKSSGRRSPAPAATPGRWLRWAPYAVLLLCAVLALTATWRNSVAVDEVGNLPRGLWIWHYGDFQLDAETTPLPMMLAALPVALTTTSVFTLSPDPALIVW